MATISKNPENVSTFGAIIEKNRRKLKMSQRELASRAGVSHTAIAKLVKGESSPKPATVRALARALGLDELALLREAGVLTEAEAPVEEELLRRLRKALSKIPESKREMAVRLFEGQAGTLAD